MDVNGIRPSQLWPERVRAELERSSGLIVLSGEKWLHIHDEFGRRRIDRDDDWVRLENSHGAGPRQEGLPAGDWPGLEMSATRSTSKGHL
jgi:hypothetical protein